MRRKAREQGNGPLRLTQAFAPILARNGPGAIIDIISVAGLVNFPSFATYSASKAAAHSLAQAQASRSGLAAQGIRFGHDVLLASPLWALKAPFILSPARSAGSRSLHPAQL